MAFQEKAKREKEQREKPPFVLEEAFQPAQVLYSDLIAYGLKLTWRICKAKIVGMKLVIG